MSEQSDSFVESESKPTLNFEGTEYLIEDLNQDALRIISALRESDMAISRHRSELTLITIARKSLISDLRTILSPEE